MNDQLNVTVGNGKYTVIQDSDGRLRALRYGEEWRDCCGDNLVHALACEVENLRENQPKRAALIEEGARLLCTRIEAEGSHGFPVHELTRNLAQILTT